MKIARPLIPLAILTLCLSAPLLADVVEESVQTFPLAAGGRVSLANINGDVVIEGWDRDEVSVEAVKRGDDQEALDRVKVKIDATENRVAIETDYEKNVGWRDHKNAAVDFKLMVPRGAELRDIDLVNGDLKVSALRGNVEADLVNGDVEASDLASQVIELATVNGTIKATLTQLAAGQRVNLESVNGRVELAVPDGADAEFRGETVHGKITSDFDFKIKKGEYVGSWLRGRLGAGGASVNLETVNGSIKISKY